MTDPRPKPLSYVGMLYNLLDSLSEDTRPADISLFIQDLSAEIEAAAERARPPQAEGLLREVLWHACVHDGKYGDDGEMQCRGADFRRDDIALLATHVQRARHASLVPTALRAEATRDETDDERHDRLVAGGASCGDTSHVERHRPPQAEGLNTVWAYVIERHRGHVLWMREPESCAECEDMTKMYAALRAEAAQDDGLRAQVLALADEIDSPEGLDAPTLRGWARRLREIAS